MTEAQIKEILQWDVQSWSKALAYWEEKINWKEVRKGLELGGRKGGLSLWLAWKGIDVVCSDLNDVKSTAEKLHLHHGVSSQISYQDINATSILYENHFDIIVFKSIIGGIGRDDNYALQKKVFKEIHKALKPGGKLLFAENLVASPLHRQLRKRFVNWGNSWRYVSLSEMQTFLEDFTQYEIKTTGFLGTFGRNEKQRNFLAQTDSLIFNKLCPDNWKYIGYGIAEK